MSVTHATLMIGSHGLVLKVTREEMSRLILHYHQKELDRLTELGKADDLNMYFEVGRLKDDLVKKVYVEGANCRKPQEGGSYFTPEAAVAHLVEFAYEP